MTRFWKASLGIAALVTLLAACGFGETLPTQNVTDGSAQLSGRVHNTVAGATSYWFEYGTTTDYGASTPHRSMNVHDTSIGYPVTETVLGLDGATTYHARLCAHSDDGGVCGSDQTFTTAGPQDWVAGGGTVFRDPQLGFSVGAGVFATSDPNGANPAGNASNTQYGNRFGEAGPVTCLRVDGNRAAIGFLASPPDGLGFPPVPPVPRLIFIEDNGATGDRYGVRDVADASVCPAPTAADFPNLFGGMVPPVFSEGGFVVHDHAA